MCVSWPGSYDSIMSESKAMILGLSGKALTEEEKAFYRAERPWGFILFARNVGTAEELRALTDDLRDLAGEGVPVFLDQEGGRVQRLRPPLAPNYPSAAAIGRLHAVDGEAGLRAAWLSGRLHAIDLARYGIDVDCLPVLDLPGPGSSNVVGDRAYGDAADTVATLGLAVMNGLTAGGVLPVIKHIPGHGRALVDSHLSLPVVDATLEELRAHDFRPFIALRDVKMAMTAHIVFTAIDAERPATLSPEVIGRIIRGEIGFGGLLMSDDLSMKALGGTFGDRTKGVFDAGCDIVLHCNGDMEEMRAVVAATPALSGDAARRAEAALASRRPAEPADEAALRKEFDALMTPAVATS